MAPAEAALRRAASREAVVTAIVIFCVAAALRAAAAAVIPFPVPEDTAYYWGVARNAVDGRGLVTDALWSYQLHPLAVPRPAFDIWLPLPTVILVPLMALLGTGFRVAQVMSVLVSSIVPVLAWRLAGDLAVERGLTPTRARTVAVGAGIVTAVEGPLVLFGALPDSTALFTVLTLAACILMERVAREPAADRRVDRRLLLLGLALGLAALTRNEVIWYVIAWVVIAASVARRQDPQARLGAFARLVVTPLSVTFLLYAPWAIRQAMTFGTPFPGQALSNAFSRTGSDIFAWSDRPSLSAWLAQGPAKLATDRVEAVRHAVVSVLAIPGFPTAIVGMAGLPWLIRSQVMRPLLIGSALTFLGSTMVFPVSTTWGTFLHAAGPVHVLLAISAVAALDRAIAAIAARRAWRPGSAWLGPIALTALTVPVLGLTVAAVASASAEVEDAYATLSRASKAAGISLTTGEPVMSDSPIWLAESLRIPTLGLPQESPRSVLDLAHTFRVTTLVVSVDDPEGRWPAVLDEGGSDAECFVPVPEAAVRGEDGSERLRVYEIAAECR
jgi:hypothetical protein